MNPGRGGARRRVLITGANGQVGAALRRLAPADSDVLALDRNRLDITDRHAVQAACQNFRPDWIINAAAYTAVDKAESAPDAAFAVNRDGVRHLAEAVRDTDTRLLHISTDYVFNGQQNRPYTPEDEPDPLNVYGRSKLAGEKAAQELLADRVCVIRTSWVYDATGRNFLTTMRRLLAERPELGVIEDQVGTPTCTDSLARVIYAAIEASLFGLYHWGDAGLASWYDFALAIQEQLCETHPVVAGCRIYPIKSRDYATAAARPYYAVLDKSPLRERLGIAAEPWRHNLRRVING